ncbi:DinB family protein [Gemmatimonas phototrophica]|uniref:DinB family protein n=1 Tax=Gemmatimonas phototrophica TaxID=1379270 RepID=UPI0006A6F6F9|nr:DinB family protein [Gemmatimonas phototrophica]
MNSGYARTLVDYHDWARDRMLEAVLALGDDEDNCALGSSFPSVRDTLRHTFGAEVVWLCRWQGESLTW